MTGKDTTPERRFEMKVHGMPSSDFTQVSRDFMRKAVGLKPSAHRVMCHLLTHTDKYGQLTKAKIARDTSMSRNTVKAALDGAASAGYLIRQEVLTASGVLVNTNYHVQCTPFSRADIARLSAPLTVSGADHQNSSTDVHEHEVTKAQELNTASAEFEQEAAQELSHIGEQVGEQEKSTPEPTETDPETDSADARTELNALLDKARSEAWTKVDVDNWAGQAYFSLPGAVYRERYKQLKLLAEETAGIVAKEGAIARIYECAWLGESDRNEVIGLARLREGMTVPDLADLLPIAERDAKTTKVGFLKYLVKNWEIENRAKPRPKVNPLWQVD